jgi:hypothetical protein
MLRLCGCVVHTRASCGCGELPLTQYCHLCSSPRQPSLACLSESPKSGSWGRRPTHRTPDPSCLAQTIIVHHQNIVSSASKEYRAWYTITRCVKTNLHYSSRKLRNSIYLLRFRPGSVMFLKFRNVLRQHCMGHLIQTCQWPDLQNPVFPSNGLRLLGSLFFDSLWTLSPAHFVVHVR